jgi:hypothetical protein
MDPGCLDDREGFQKILIKQTSKAFPAETGRVIFQAMRSVSEVLHLDRS